MDSHKGLDLDLEFDLDFDCMPGFSARLAREGVSPSWGDVEVCRDRGEVR